MDGVTQDRLKVGFDRAAHSYAASRPGYPGAAVDWLLGVGAQDVLDLAAGSGSLTHPLRRRAPRVVAAEPSPNLVTELRAADPNAPAVLASAERLPFADRAFDLVTVATAFHWFDAAQALPEMARVLRPGGHLALVWNSRAKTSPASKELGALLRSAQPPTLTGDWGVGSVHALDDSAHFCVPKRATFPHEQSLTREALVQLVESRSYVIALDSAARASLLDKVRELFDAHVGDDGLVRLPYQSECFRSAVRP